MPVEAITIVCGAQGCGGHGGHLYCYCQGGRREFELWAHQIPASHAFDELGNVRITERAKERGRLRRPLTARKPPKKNDLTKLHRGRYEMRSDCRFIEYPDMVLETECVNCERAISFSLAAALLSP